MHYKAVDNVGNVKTGYYGPYKIDKTIPTASADISSRDWANTDAAVTLTYADADSGVNTKQYAWSTATSTPASWTNYSTAVSQSTNGIWYLHYKAVDNVGNVKTGYYGPYKIDKTIPTASADISSRDWANTDAAVTLTYADADSGVNTKQYAWSTATSTPASWTNYSTVVSQSTNGIWYLHYKAVDNAGNVKTGYYGPYKIDKTIPTASADIESRALDNTDVNVNLSFTDLHSGVNTKQYAWSTLTTAPSAWINYIDTVTQSAEGEWYLHYKAIDKAGNIITGYYGPYIIKFVTIKNSQITAQTGEKYKVLFEADNLMPQSKVNYTVEYNANQIKAVDLFGSTDTEELQNGITIEDITITQFTEIGGTGIIEFRVEKQISENTTWSGIVNSIKFVGVNNGNTVIKTTVSIE